MYSCMSVPLAAAQPVTCLGCEGEPPQRITVAASLEVFGLLLYWFVWKKDDLAQPFLTQPNEFVGLH